MAFTITIDTVPSNDYLIFSNDSIIVSATSAGSLQAGEYIYLFNYIDNGYLATSSTDFSASISGFSNGLNLIGIQTLIKDGTDTIVSAIYSNQIPVSANRLPNISFAGTPNVDVELTFEDVSYPYLPETLDSYVWNFGDGGVSSTTAPTIEHSFSALGDYIVSVSAIDISGNVGVKTETVSMIESNTCKAKEDYITICGPDMLGRFGDCKQINLVEYLPLYLRGGETEEFLLLFEEFLNNMFDGLCGWQVSANDLSINKNWMVENSGTISADVQQTFTYDLCGTNESTVASDAQELQLHWPTNAAYATSAQKISILEKVKRLTELQDPDLIDIEYIQFFAANLGYDINISRDEAGVSGTASSFGLTEFGGSCSAADINHYLRFIVRNLPTWYKIKTTRNSIKVMLYSFGLVGDLVEYFTKDYGDATVDNFARWRVDFNNDLAEIPSDWFPTPHFAVKIDIDASSDISFDVDRRDKVIRAIESVRPINTVFRTLFGYFQRIMEIYVFVRPRFTRYIQIKPTDWANYFDGSPPTYGDV